jgi:hypothetical protein
MLALSVAPCHAGLDYEPFAYTGTELNAMNGSTVWGGAWTTSGTTSNTLSNDGISLAYPVPFAGGYSAPATSGSRVSTGGFGSIAVNYRLLSETIPLNQEGTTRFASALFRKNLANGSATDNVLIEFYDGSNNRRWGFGIQGSDDKPWLNANGSLSVDGPEVVAGETYFLVAKIVSAADPNANDIAYLKVFGTNYATEVPLTEPEAWDLSLTEKTGALLDRIRVRIDPANPEDAPGMVDEIRIGSSWLDVLGPLGSPQQPDPISGDYDGNGAVDAADYVVWRQNEGGPGGSWTLGDYEPDNDVDSADYDFWRGHFGNTSGSGAGAAVPEPISFALVLTALLPVATVRRRVV